MTQIDSRVELRGHRDRSDCITARGQRRSARRSEDSISWNERYDEL